MGEAFSFRFSPETTWDDNVKARPILSLILARVPGTSVGARATNEAETDRLGFMKLTAGGLSDSVTLKAVETHDNPFDVFPGLSGSHLLGLGALDVTVRCLMPFLQSEVQSMQNKEEGHNEGKSTCCVCGCGHSVRRDRHYRNVNQVSAGTGAEWRRR
jgi:hypothetical protein